MWLSDTTLKPFLPYRARRHPHRLVQAASPTFHYPRDDCSVLCNRNIRLGTKPHHTSYDALQVLSRNASCEGLTMPMVMGRMIGAFETRQILF